MINNHLIAQIERNFGLQPTEEQQIALQKLAEFLLSVRPDGLLLLKGYAGTGKSSLVGAFVRTLNELGQKCVLMAPTGRAAKVFSGYAEQKAFTIHKKIYRQKRFSGETARRSYPLRLFRRGLPIDSLGRRGAVASRHAIGEPCLRA